MNNWMDILYLLTILIEATLLCYLEYKIWKTIYTPLFFLILPYLIILFITIMASGGKSGLVEFYYPSIFIWSAGLLIFFIPSAILGGLMKYNGKSIVTRYPDDKISPTLILLLVFISLLFIVHLRGALRSSAEAFGSDDFGTEFSGGGLWGHLRIFTLPLLMMSIYYVSKKRWWLWPFILVFLAVGVLNQVKGWIIIPVLSAIAMRLYVGKTRLTIKFLLYVLLGVFLIFFASYALSILVVQSRGVNDAFMEFILMHFLHYLTSGTLGLSMDMQQGFPDAGSFEVIWSPIINLFNAIVGNDDFIVPVNPIYYNSGINLTNVRTYFGTIYIYTDIFQFVGYILLSSTMLYFLRLAIIKWNNIYIYVIYFFECGLLLMGWFEFYNFHLLVFEFPAIALALLFMEWILRGKKDECKCLQI